MKIQLFTDTKLNYNNKNVFKSVKSTPIAELSLKHFNFNDMINSTVILDKTSNIPINLVTYLIVIEDEKEYHYWVTSIKFLSKGKYSLGLKRNIWPDLISPSIQGVIKRGYANTLDIANYKSNTIKVNKSKIKEIYLTDEFTKKGESGEILSPTQWGILYTAQTTDDNIQIDLDSKNYNTIEDVKDQRRYLYTTSSFSNNINQKFQVVTNYVCLIISSDGNAGSINNIKKRAAIFKCFALLSWSKNNSNTSGAIYQPQQLISTPIFSGLNTAPVSMPDNTIILNYYTNGDYYNNPNILNDENMLNYCNLFCSSNKTINLNVDTGDGLNDNSIINNITYSNTPIIQQGENIVSNNNTYIYQPASEINNGAIIKEQVGVNEEFYKINVTYNDINSTINIVNNQNYNIEPTVDSINKIVYTDNELLNILMSTTLNNSVGNYNLSIFIPPVLKYGGIDNYSYSTYTITYDNDVKSKVLIKWLAYRAKSSKEKFQFYTTENSTDYTFRQTGTIKTHIFSYTQLPSKTNVTFKGQTLNNGVVLSEPFGIIAIPLFDCKYKLTPTSTVVSSNSTDSQRVFYNLIAKYSGGSNPFIIDAQIIPYAPTIFKNNLKNKNQPDEYIDYSTISDIISNRNEPETFNYNGAPIIMLDSANINISTYQYLKPYSDTQKEYTCREYRLMSPGQDSSFDMKYYDYNSFLPNSQLIFKDINGNPLGDSIFNIDITLKPFNLYMHASMFVRDGSLIANQEFDDIRGMVCGGSIFQCTLTSNAFQTYKRENSMFDQIQQRKIETMHIGHDAERTNEIWSGVTTTLQNTMFGALAGGAIADFTVLGNNAKGASAILGSTAAGASTGVGVIAQYQKNEELRNREISDAQYFFDTQIQTIKNLPNTLNRVSGFNQDILNHFCIYVEVYDCTPREHELYDMFVSECGNSLEIIGNINNYLVNGKYIQASVFRTDTRPEITSALKDDLMKGVYYYEQI